MTGEEMMIGTAYQSGRPIFDMSAYEGRPGGVHRGGSDKLFTS